MKSFLVVFFLISQAFAQDDLFSSEFESLLLKYKISPILEQTYCYSENGQVSGSQVDKLQRIASVTKIITTFHASEVLDLNKTYETRLIISPDGKNLHIQGSLDPYFEEEKLLLLFKGLNEQGYKSFKKVTFDQNFWFYDLPLDSYEPITPQKTLARLSYFLNSRNKAQIKTLWKQAVAFAKEEGVDLDAQAPVMTASQVQLVPTNLEQEPTSKIFIHTSLPLHRILKSMNVMSKNHVAQNVFLEASKIKNLTEVLSAVNVPLDSIRIYTGSGLPIIKGRNRTDNLCSCRTVLRIFELLEESLKKHGLYFNDVVAITGGKDLGSFRERFKKYAQAEDSIFAKTGTLKNASSLAGVILAKDEIPFAVLNHTPSVGIAREFQDEFVSLMLGAFEPLSPFPYEKISIFPWDGSEILKVE